MLITQLLLLAGFVLVHFSAVHLLRFEEKIRGSFLSFAGGTAVAYVFLHLLPELGESHEKLREAWAPYGLDEIAGYMGAVVGLVFFYGIERLVSRTKKNAPEGEAPNSVFWLHVFSFALYNFVIGHLLAEYHEEGGAGVWIYFIAMSFHFITNDLSLYHDHKRLYSKIGRWVVVAAIIAGWYRGHTSEVSEALFASLFAFVAGGMVMNVMKEELPEAAESRFFMFFMGVLAFGALLHFL